MALGGCVEPTLLLVDYGIFLGGLCVVGRDHVCMFEVDLCARSPILDGMLLLLWWWWWW